jgi:hypothetical protein
MVNKNMNQNEASAILGPYDDLQDAFELQLFEFKKQLIALAPIEKLIAPKLKKIKQLQEAFLLLGGEIDEISISTYELVSPSENILESFKAYQDVRNNFKKLLSQSNSHEEIANFCQYLVAYENIYASCWFSNSLDTTEIVSKEPDPMEVLKAIREYNENGGFTFEDLRFNKNNPPAVLIKERNRLSLLATKFSDYDGGNFRTS